MGPTRSPAHSRASSKVVCARLQERVVDQVRARGPRLRVDYHRAPQEVAPVLAEAPGDRGGRRGVGDLEDCGEVVRERGPRVVCSGHLDYGRADAPHVGGAPVAGLFDDLGRHPRHRARDRLVHRVLEGVRAEPLQLLRTAEVGELRDALLVHEHVSPLNVAVDDPLPVEVGHPLHDLVRIPLDQRLVEDTELAQHARDRTTGHIFQEDVE
mmetsp:Transcript_39364/g.90680  ORF Transcript_39364/g.90680 Transcript_39364/m.90680 type:complete len:211 (-) Transcript_39364:319-951(-)